MSDEWARSRNGQKLFADVGRIADALERLEHRPASIERVWLIHQLDTRAPLPVDEFMAYASADSCRKALRSMVLSNDHSTHWQNWNRIDAWDGLSPLVVGPFRVQAVEVQR